MTDNKKRNLFLLAITILFLAYCIPIIFQGTANYRMIKSFNADEGTVVIKLSRMFANSSLFPNHIRYGDFYFYINYFVIWLIKTIFSLKSVSDQIIVISSRLVDVVFAILSVGGLCILSQRIYNFSIGALAGLFLLTTPNFLFWSTIAKPDIPQIFFLIISIYFCVRLLEEYSNRDMILSTVFTGLSFGTKYSGIFLLPLVCLASSLPLIKQKQRQYLQIVKRTVIIGFIFMVTFFITNPYALIKFRTYQSVIRYQSAYLKFGHLFKEGDNPLLWLKVLGSEQLLGNLGLALFLIFSVITSWRLIRKKGGKPESFQAELFIQGWIFFFLFYLMWRIYHRPYRFLLAIVPFIYIFISVVINRLFNNQHAIKIPAKVGRFAALGLMACLLWPKLMLDYNYFNSSLHKEENSPAITAGKYLEQNFPHNITITYDAYSYIPPSFKKASRHLGQNTALINKIKPDLIIVNDDISLRYKDFERVSLARNPEFFKSCYSFYNQLEHNKFPPYRRIKDFGGIRIYKKF